MGVKIYKPLRGDKFMQCGDCERIKLRRIVRDFGIMVASVEDPLSARNGSYPH
jgi:hypothetical protein